MFTYKPFFLLAAVLLIPCAMAQQMYKVVGPDGKVTFSDKPPAKSGKVSVMHSYTLRPYESPADLAAEAAARKAAAAAPRAAVVPPTPTPALSREVEDAIVTVRGQDEFTRRFYNFCNGNLESAKAFGAAARAWRQRNAVPVAHQNRLLMEVASPGKRDELLGRVATMLDDESAKMVARNPKERLAWCAEAVAELESGKSDIAQPAMMAVPVIPYRAK